MKKLLAASLLLAVAVSGANAATVLTGTIFEVTVSDPVSVGSGAQNLVQYIVSAKNISGDAGLNPTTFAGIATGGVVASGQLHNEQFVTGFPVAQQQPSPTGATAANSDVDTHWLAIGTVIASPLTEDVVDENSSDEPGDNGPNPAVKTGYATALKGGSAFEGAGPFAESIDVLQVVVPAGTAWNLSLQVAAAGQADDFRAEIPEPATMGLLSLGGLALIRRRK